jgi:hypothetical protein
MTLPRNSKVFVKHKDKFYQIVTSRGFHNVVYVVDSVFYVNRDKVIFIKNRFSDPEYTLEDMSVITLSCNSSEDLSRALYWRA